MGPNPTRALYPAARVAAGRAYSHFSGGNIHFQDIAGSNDLDVWTIETMLDVAFWASLRREEGFSPRVSLAYVSPESVLHPMRFARAIPLDAETLTRLAPAVEHPGIHLGVRRIEDELYIWGAVSKLPAHSMVIEVIAPGLLLIKASRAEESGKFLNFAVLEGDQVKVIDHDRTTPECPALLTSLLEFPSRSFRSTSANIFVKLAIAMRAHGRGGSLLIVPPEGAEWRESILQPIKYSVDPAFTGLSVLLQAEPPEEQRARWQDKVRRTVEEFAGLTAVDGTTIMTDGYSLLAFGAKILRRSGRSQVDRVLLTEPIEGTKAKVMEPGQLGGTRHLSAAQFVNDQRNSIALVASQDGRFTVFGWSTCEELVHAHRIETLLL